jgi:hypothetical protein
MWMAAVALVLAPALQRQPPASPWTVAPFVPTVGDTVWLERVFTIPTGWRLRPGRLESTDIVEPLMDPLVVRRGADWVVRYAVVAWAPGKHDVTLPPVWRLGASGEADSVPGGTATFTLRSVIPDSVTRPEPRPALAPLRTERSTPAPVLLAVLVAGVSLGGALWWRRRPPRRLAAPTIVAGVAEIPDRRWLEAGEPKAVAARAAGRLRTVLARVVPDAHAGLSTAECLEVVRRHRPQSPVQALAVVLGGLDRVAFGTGASPDVTVLVRQAETLAQDLER